MQRRTFLLGTAAILGGAAAPWLLGLASRSRPEDVYLPPTLPRRAAVVWFSQTGHTRRVGRLIAHRWRTRGLDVVASDYREFDRATMTGLDLVVLGSPVNYYEVPGHFRAWIESLPPLAGARCAAYATFGGDGGNPFNTAAGLLDRLAGLGALPVDLALFGNMSTYAPTWSLGNGRRILRYRHLPDADTWMAVRRFADDVLERVRTGTGTSASTEWNPRELIKGAPSIAGTKWMMSDHRVEPEACAGCGACARGCPVGAIEPATLAVDTARCIACLGCLNNCPAGAMKLRFLGTPLLGFTEFLRRNSITIAEPPELAPPAHGPAAPPSPPA